MEDLNTDIDVNQKRIVLEDPKDRKTKIITNILIYCSQYYPATKGLAADVIKALGQEFLPYVYEAISFLYKCLEREIISGPSSSHIPASEIPRLFKLDSSFLLDKQNSSQQLKEMEQALKQLHLEQLIPKSRLKELLWYNCSKYLSMKCVQQNNLYYKYYRNQVEIDGENWLQSTPFSALIALLQFLFETIVNHIKLSQQYERKVKLLWARLSQLHNKHLKSPVKKLSNIVLNNYKNVLSLSLNNISFQDYIELLLEYAFSLLFYYKYSQSEMVMKHCSHLLKMKMEFTGKLGRRTKYQVFDTPLLVMNLVEENQKQNANETHEIQEEEEGEKIQLINAKELVTRQRGISLSQSSNSINASTFEQQSILLQQPKFVQSLGQHQNSLKQVNEHHLLVALGILYFQWRSTPHDDMLLQSISTSIMTLLKVNVQTSFAYTFALLLLRSLNEFPRIKNTERALEQLEKLKMGYNGKAIKNISNLYATPYETYLSFILILAERYMEIGLSTTAIVLFQQAGLYEECIDGLIAKSYKEKALELANRQIDQKGKNPRLLCMLGDLHKGNEVKYYEQSWELSNGTYARAQRSLGWYYFNKNDFQKAAQSFTKATQASYYHPSTWFTLGCSYMRLNQFDKALKAFSECISIDDTQGDAWGNMASCYMYQKKMKEAFSTLSQAVRYSEGNWKLWMNLLSVSLTIKQFYKYFECIERLVKLDHQEVLTEEILAKVVQIMKYHNETSQRKRVVFNFKNRIDRMFAFLEEKIGENELVWGSKASYQIEMLQYYDILDVHYHNLHLEKKIDPNDLMPGYETIESTSMTTKTKILQTKVKIVQSKQLELNMTMKVGWHQNKIQCERVKKVLEQYVEIYRQYSNREDKQDFKLFVKGVVQKVSHCLQQPYEIVLEWL